MKALGSLRLALPFKNGTAMVLKTFADSVSVDASFSTASISFDKAFSKSGTCEYWIGWSERALRRGKRSFVWIWADEVRIDKRVKPRLR